MIQNRAKQREKHLWSSVTITKTLPWVFSRFLNCTNGTKSRKSSCLMQQPGWINWNRLKIEEFLISSMALGLVDQLQIFSQLYLIEFLGLLKRSGATRAVALDIYKDFGKVRHAGLLHKLKSYLISGQVFGLISSFLSNRRFRVVLDEKSSQECPVSAWVFQGFILGPILFLLYINDLPDDVICNIGICADVTTLYSKFDQASVQWQQLELALNLNLIYETM